MEIEIKYKIRDKALMSEILNDEYLAGMEEKCTREQLFMKAAYFDTECGTLSQNDIAFRVRMEGSRIIASLKWNGAGGDGLHMTEEINVPVNDQKCFIMPSPEIFGESDVGKDVIELLNGRPLQSILEMKFLRTRFRVDTGNAICELSLDDGDIITDAGNCRISEMEIELFSGEKDELIQMGAKLAEKYGLEPERESKYARGLRFIRESLEN